MKKHLTIIITIVVVACLLNFTACQNNPIVEPPTEDVHTTPITTTSPATTKAEFVSEKANKAVQWVSDYLKENIEDFNVLKDEIFELEDYCWSICAPYQSGIDQHYNFKILPKSSQSILKKFEAIFRKQFGEEIEVVYKAAYNPINEKRMVSVSISKYELYVILNNYPDGDAPFLSDMNLEKIFDDWYIGGDDANNYFYTELATTLFVSDKVKSTIQWVSNYVKENKQDFNTLKDDIFEVTDEIYELTDFHWGISAHEESSIDKYNRDFMLLPKPSQDIVKNIESSFRKQFGEEIWTRYTVIINHYTGTRLLAISIQKFGLVVDLNNYPEGYSPIRYDMKYEKIIDDWYIYCNDEEVYP